MGGIPNTHKQASIADVPPRQKKEVNLRLKDNLEQNFQPWCRKAPTCGKPERKQTGSWNICADEGVRSTPCNQWAEHMHAYSNRRRIQCHHDGLISFMFNQQILISENREMLMCHILQQRKGIWKWSSECGRKDKALPSPEIWTRCTEGMA